MLQVAVSRPLAANVAILSLGIDVSRWFPPGGRLSPAELGELHSRFALRALESSESDLFIASKTAESSHAQPRPALSLPRGAEECFVRRRHRATRCPG